MKIYGAYEAKTNFSKLLEFVIKGEKITITKHGVPVAIIQPAVTKPKIPVLETIEQLIEFRKGNRLGDISISELIKEGRR
jgi:prevent-host-death family protein